MIRRASQALLDVRELSRSFRHGRRLFDIGSPGLTAVDGVSFTLRPGEILGLAGESGSGKSTLGRLVAQLIRPDRGEILLDGAPVRDLGLAARRRVQLIFQDPSAALSPRRTIRQTLLEPLRHFRLAEPAQHGRLAIEALEAVGLDAVCMGRFPHQFSTGQRQRICLARALLAQPDLVIADEAVSSLDVSVQAQVLELIHRLRDDKGIASLFISHDLAVIRQLADTVAVMLEGRLVEYGPAEQVLSAPAHPYTLDLLSAVLDPDPARNSQQVLGPSALSLRRGGAGCAYAGRCPRALELCARDRPLDRDTGQAVAHTVQCHLYPA